MNENSYTRWEDPIKLQEKFDNRQMRRDEYRYWCSAYRAYKTSHASSVGVPRPYGASYDTATFNGHLVEVRTYLVNLAFWRQHCPMCEYRALTQSYRDYLYEQEADVGESLYVANLEHAASLYHAGYGNPSIPV